MRAVTKFVYGSPHAINTHTRTRTPNAKWEKNLQKQIKSTGKIAQSTLLAPKCARVRVPMRHISMLGWILVLCLLHARGKLRQETHTRTHEAACVCVCLPTHPQTPTQKGVSRMPVAGVSAQTDSKWWIEMRARCNIKCVCDLCFA